MTKKLWVASSMLVRKERVQEVGDRLCGFLPVFETKKAALRWADGKAEVYALVKRAEHPDA